MTATTTASTALRRPQPHTIGWIGLSILAAFIPFAVAADQAADSSTGLPADHSGIIATLAGTSWPAFKVAHRGTAQYLTLLERAYALHELTITILFLIIVLVPFRERRRWAWWTCWMVIIACLGCLLTFGVHDHTILPRALIAVAALPVLLLIALPGFLGPPHGSMTVAAPGGTCLLTFRLYARAAVRWGRSGWRGPARPGEAACLGELAGDIAGDLAADRVGVLGGHLRIDPALDFHLRSPAHPCPRAPIPLLVSAVPPGPAAGRLGARRGWAPLGPRAGRSPPPPPGQGRNS